MASLKGFFRVRVPANQAKPGPPLAPVLGQQQVKPADFIAEFHRQSAGYTDGVPLHVRGWKVGGRLRLAVCPPAYHLVLRGAPTAVDLYTALVYRLDRPPTPADARTLFGAARSGRCRVQLR